MKVGLLEPLRVSADLIQQLAAPIKEAGHEFVYYDEKTTDPEELAARSQDLDIAMIANNPYPQAAFRKAKHLKLINVAFTGVDHVDTQAAKEQGIQVANAAGYSDTAVSELVIGLVLAVYRQISQGNHNIRQEDFPGAFQGREIKGKTVGIIGTGKIGMEVARLFHAFGAELFAYSRTEKAAAKALGVKYVELDELLAASDIVTIHLPQNETTQGMISRKKLEKMAADAILVNCARGPIIDNEALAELLNDGQIAGAGIDVFTEEPPLPEDKPLLHAKNAVLTPHIGYLTDEAMVARAQIAFDNTLAYLKGHPQNIVE